MSAPHVLIVGAGPTGLVLALTLAALNVPIRIIDNELGPGRYSRAISIHARTLEIYRQLGFAEELIARGVKLEQFKLRSRGQTFVNISLADLGGTQSLYPFILGLPQDEHEAFLAVELQKRGVEVEWGVTFTGLTQSDHGVVATLVRGDAKETVSVAYLCGCDGASSPVRHQLGIQFSGGTYTDLFFVADANLEAVAAADMVINLGASSFVAVMPIRTSGMHRIVGIVPSDLLGKPGLTFDDVRGTVEELTSVKVKQVNWFSTYHVHHRVADHFQQGRCFLLGDASHVHSPAGGQGMNTGIGDAFNLGWKIADVMVREAPDRLLESYEIERRAFAQVLVDSTDRAFEAMVGSSLANKLLRTWVIPFVLPRITQFAAARARIFQTISQIRIQYRASPISRGQVGSVTAGDRLPWCAFGDTDNFSPLQSLDWQIQIYGDVAEPFRTQIKNFEIAVHCFPWNEAAGSAGLMKNAVYLVRPDGHIGLALVHQDAKIVGDYIEEVFGVRRLPLLRTTAPLVTHEPLTNPGFDT